MIKLKRFLSILGFRLLILGALVGIAIYQIMNRKEGY